MSFSPLFKRRCDALHQRRKDWFRARNNVLVKGCFTVKKKAGTIAGGQFSACFR